MAQLRVGLLGDGHINGVVRQAIEAERPYRLVGTFGRSHDLPGASDVDVIVEAATQRAVHERVPGILASGVDVILLSVGALADAELRARLTASAGDVTVHRAGRVIACSGAIGGLDQVRALRASGPLARVTLESRKLPSTLIQPWMDAELQDALRAGDTEVVLADGLAADVARQFPASANIAASLALAADAWDFATARIVADPAAILTRHEIHAVGELGAVNVVVTNAPSPERPRSSAIVAWAALRSLDDYARAGGFAAPDGIPFG